ncbi:MAG: 30S ribosomal protein S6--L-glutamate ligase, partial [Acidimicrobiia bacterium]
VKLTPGERATAVRAARTMELNVAGVDMVQSESGPMVLEVNSSPGLEGIEEASGIDIADAIVEFMEDNADTEPQRRGRA